MQKAPCNTAINTANNPDEHIDFTPLSFGKYRGLTPEQVAQDDPGYITWAYESIVDRKICSKALYQDCKQDINERYQPALDKTELTF